MNSFMESDYVQFRQRTALPLYGAKELFLEEKERYRSQMQQLSLASVRQKLLLCDFSSLRALKAALMALNGSGLNADLLLDATLNEEEQRICRHLAGQAGVRFIWNKQREGEMVAAAAPRAFFSASGTRFADLSDGAVLVIGEQFNPNFRIRVKKILQERQEELLGDILLEQQGNGASLLCLGSEARGLDAASTMQWLLPHYARLVDLPVYLEPERVAYLETILPLLPGCPLILCRQHTREERERLFALCRSTPTKVVLGAAKLENRSKEARLKAARQLVAEALGAGLPYENLLLEAATIAAPGAPLLLQESLEAISLLKAEFGLPVLVPISQVSRSRLVHGWSNAFYAACAIDRGADLLLANPSQREVMGIVQAANELRC